MASDCPFADNSFDSALSTFTLCTIPDAASALLEVRRVLRPGGTFHFVEHGRAPDEKVRRWQHRMEPLHRALSGAVTSAVRSPNDRGRAGFTSLELDIFYEPAAPKYASAMSLGIAVK